MVQKNIIINLLNIRQDEKPMVFLLLAYSFCIGIGLYIYYTAATTLFLTMFDAKMLPVAYIAGGIFLYVIAKLNSIIQKYISFSSLALLLVTLLSASLLILLVCYSLLESKWIVFLLYLWIRINLFVFSFTFWVSASSLFDLGQAKRLYSLIGTGEVLASITANFVVKTLISGKIVEVESLLYIAVGFIILSILFINKIIKKNKEKLLFRKSASVHVDNSVPLPSKKYPVLMYLLGLIPIACLYIIEFSFSVDSKKYFPDKDQLAIFLGQFLFICSLIEILVKGILFRFVTKTYGIMAGLILMPVSLIIISFLLFLMTALSVKIFFLVLISRFLITSVRRSFSDTSYQLLYQPIPRAESIQLQNQVETYAKPLGYVVAGGILIVLNFIGFSSTVYIFMFLMIFLVLWAVLAFMMQSEYKRTLLNILFATKAYAKEKAGSGINNQFIDSPNVVPVISFEEMIKLTESSQSIDREKAAYLLGKSGRFYAYKYIIKLLDDKDISVKLSAIRASANIKRAEVIPFLLPGINVPELQLVTKDTLSKIGEPIIDYLNVYFNKYDKKTDVISILTEVLESIGGVKAIRFLRSKLMHPSSEVAIRAMESLIRLNYKPNQGEQSYLITQIDSEVNAYLWILAAENDLKDSLIRHSLFDALKAERKKSMLKILTILSFLRGDTQFEKIEELMYGPYPQTKSYLADLVSLLIESEEISIRVLTLFENISDFDILLKYENRYPQQNLSTEKRLLTIINKDNLDSLTKALAIKEVLQFHDENAIKVLAANVKTDNILLAEAALYGLAKSNPTRFDDISAYFNLKKDRRYIDLCNKVKSFNSEEDLTITNVENSLADSKLLSP